MPEEQYIKALIADFKADISLFPAPEIQTIFIGGGTPSLFSADAYAQLFNQLQDLVIFSPTIEITLEANPGTIEQQRFNDYRRLGINRLSLGIQSFNARHLKALGRIHDDYQAHRAIESARQAGFENINLDLMHGLPQQTLSEGLNDLETALNYEPEHLSWYQLTIEPNTAFYKSRPILPHEDMSSSLEEEGLQLLQAQGFERYEISAFCRNGLFARHNLNYWLFGDYYGIGAGAHGKLSLSLKPKPEIYRSYKYRQPQDYLKADKSFLVSNTKLTEEALIFEFMLNTTRLQQPIPYTLFEARTGLSFEKIAVPMQKAVNKGLILMDKTAWQVTPFGRRFTNDLQAIFL